MSFDAASARIGEPVSSIPALDVRRASTTSPPATSFQRALASHTTSSSSSAPMPAGGAGPHYGFVRRTDAFPSDLAFYQRLAENGLGGVVFDSTDPGLDAAIATARQAGLQAGIWVPAGLDAGDPEVYARYAAGLAQKYGPSVLVLDVEWGGKGYPGSDGWNWSEKMMSAYRALAADQSTAVTVMPNQDDFNYGAYTARGVPVWAQAYGATMDEQYDPAAVVDVLVRNGVPKQMAVPVLAAGQAPGSYEGRFAAFTVDDLDHGDLQKMGLSRPAASGQATSAPRQGDPSEAAEAYALRRLRQMVEVGLIPSLPVPGSGGYAAIWRELSGLLAEPAGQAGFRDPGYWLRVAAEQAVRSRESGASDTGANQIA